MRVPAQADGTGILVHDRPADVVVAAQVGQPRRRRGLGRQRAERVRRQPNVLRGEHRPDVHHEAVVVGEVADLAAVGAGAEVGQQLGRGHDRLGLERDRGARDPGHGPQHLGEGVHLGLALAVGAEALPQEGDGIQAQHVDAAVGQVEDDRRVLAQHRGVAPVDVPLELVERRPHPALQVLVPGEVAGGEVGEDLGQGRLVRVGHVAVGEDVEVLAVRRVTGARLDGPLVLTGDVVEHEVEHQAHPGVVQPGREVLEVVHRAQVGAHRPVVGHGIPAVAVALARAQQRHEVQVAHPELVEVGQVVGHSTQVTGEAFGVRRVADHRRVLEPVGAQHALEVTHVQAVRAGGEGSPRELDQVGTERPGPLVAVGHPQAVDQVGPPAGDAGAEHHLPVG